jgi:hypothetical protein
VAEIIPVLGAAGFVDVDIRDRFDCFRGTTKEKTARKYGVLGMNIFARKPAHQHGGRR